MVAQAPLPAAPRLISALAARDLQIPVRYVGVGESSDDLQPFNPQEFAAALFS